VKITLLSFAILLSIVGGFQLSTLSAQDSTPEPSASRQSTVVADQDESIAVRQERVANNYGQLEQKLLSLFEYEKDNNPARSKLLRRAFELSQRQGTTDELKKVVALIGADELKDAQLGQKQVLADLNKLLALLQSEDRGKRIDDELKRNLEYLKEVERLIRIQKSLRGQTEGGVDAPRLAKSQKQIAERAKKLADKIREAEEAGKETGGERSEGKPNDSEPSESKSDGKKSNDDLPKKDSSNPDQPDSESNKKNKNENKESDSSPTDKDKDNQSQSEPKAGEPNDGKPADGKQADGKQADGQSESQPSQPAANPPESDRDESESNPVRKRIAAAEDRMRQAKKKLDQAKRKQAVEDMLEAERELEAARQELEEILRQLREEEVERTLAQLEGRFRKMLERELKIKQQTESLSRVVPEQRRADFEIKAGKLAGEQNSIATEASRALLLLREDGSSIAFPQTVEEMKLDMQQVARRLGESRVGPITIEIENDIIETLNDLVKALASAQKENEKANSRPGGPGGSMSPGDLPLVNQLAEIRMLRALQDRIYRRHTRYSKMIDNPDDPVGETDDPEIRSALQRLTQKQKQLTEIAKEIVAGLAK
jgi:hypothetical protein